MNAAEHAVTVWFVAPVEGRDSLSGELFVSNRHVVQATWAQQSPDETRFIAENGEIVARWSTSLIDRLVWQEAPVVTAVPPSPLSNPGVGTKEWRERVVAKFPSAYARWTPEEDERLRVEFAAGKPAKEIATLHQRRPGGIRARLVHLGLLDKFGQRIEEANQEPAVVEVPPPGPTKPTECVHGLTLATCADCAATSNPIVYVSGGGSAYHARRDCPALLEGQALVLLRGGETADIRAERLGWDSTEGRDACRHCKPPELT